MVMGIIGCIKLKSRGKFHAFSSASSVEHAELSASGPAPGAASRMPPYGHVRPNSADFIWLLSEAPAACDDQTLDWTLATLLTTGILLSAACAHNAQSKTCRDALGL